MFFRVFLSVVLIAFGIASPWLVRDWLDSRPSHREVGAVVQRVMERTRDWAGSIEMPWRGEPEDSDPGPAAAAVSDDPSKTRSTLLDATPHPLASASGRIFEGLFGGGAPSSNRAAFPGPEKPPTTPHSREIVTGVGGELEEELSSLGLSMGSPVFVRVFKEERELEVWIRPDEASGFELFRVYPIRHLAGRLGPKRREGDGQMPEGFYRVGSSHFRPDTRHHLGIDLGYPNDLDTALGRSGSDILLHGGRGSAGALALEPGDMDEVYALAEAAFRGEQRFFRVHVFPFRMTDRRMDREWKRQPKWIEFWSNLKEGYDFFENAKFPPEVETRGAIYIFRFP